MRQITGAVGLALACIWLEVALVPRRDAGACSVKIAMADSRKIAGLVGPTVLAMVVSEFPLVQPHLYDEQIPPVVYLSGTLMFVGGLAVVRSHNLWVRNWTVLVTLSGWFFLVLGLFRMFAAGSYQRGAANTSATTFMVLEGILALLSLYMTVKAYSVQSPHDGSS